MKIISYNVNGIRAAMRKGLLEWLQTANPNVVCLQEIKASKEQLNLDEIEAAGYPFHYWHSAEKKGYSGVAILSQVQPKNVVYGTGISYIDAEGRVLRADFENFSVLSLYLPSASNIDRLPHKFKFMADFQAYINELKKEIPNLIISGDYNICHEAIDIHDPVRLKYTSGFLPEERAWMSGFLKSGFKDSFRELNKEPHHYSWWSYRAGARQRNKGWRLDYQLVSDPLKEKIKRAVILKDAVHSDHCPVFLEIEN